MNYAMLIIISDKNHFYKSVNYLIASVNSKRSRDIMTEK